MAGKFFLISQVFYPDQVSTASLFTDLCRVLASEGTKVEVWAAHPSYTEKERQSSDKVHHGIKIKYLPSTNFRKSSLIGRMLNMVTFTLSSSVKLLFSHEKNPVWTHTTPPFLGIILSLICRIKRRKFVYILLDILPEGMIRLNKLSGNNLFVMIWHKLFIRTLTRSEKIIVLGRDMIDWLRKVSPEIIAKTSYIPHWHDENLIFPIQIDVNPFVAENELNGKFIVQYCGNMGLWNDMRAIGRAVNMNMQNVFYLFIGSGMRKPELLDELANELDNYTMLDFQPKERLNVVLSACHAHLVSLGDGLEGMAVPSKIYGILASGRPVIALVPDDSEIAMIVREEDCGIVINPSDSEALCGAITLLKTDSELWEKYCINSRKAFEKKYTTKIISQKYKAIIHELSTELSIT